ncbi:MAG: PEGA domain-containing protein [Methanolinea sp.]|nr:PEGA domain-containing protein [Methanolinea sp.]
MESPVLRVVVLCAVLCIFSPVAAESAAGAAGNTGIYRFHTNVDGAEVLLDGQPAGTTRDYILDVPVNLSGPFYRTYTVQKEGYETYRGVIQSVPKKGEVLHVYVVMSAKPPVPYGKVHLLVSPAGADVTFDGKPAGQVPPSGVLVIYNVAPGSHPVVVSKDGYEPFEGWVTVSPNEAVKFPVTLAEKETGTLSVISDPPGARVLVDGAERGVTPLSVTGLAAGPHSVRIAGAGYQEYVSSVDVIAGETATVQVSLVPVGTTPNPAGRSPLPPLLLLAGLGIGAVLAARRSR